MGKTRKDTRGYALHTGEYQRPGGGYSYSYKDPAKGRHTIYANTLQELRLKERQIRKDLDEGCHYYDGEKVTLNELFDDYMRRKHNLKPTTRANYIYMYDRFVRDGFGRRRLSGICYSDVKEFYYTLLDEQKLAANTLDIINTMLHPAFMTAVRDGLMRSNPSDGVMNEIRRSNDWERPQRHALTVPQQIAFMEFTKNSRELYGWYPVITVLLGTGMRIGECLGLRWDDLDFENRTINVNHNLTRYLREDGVRVRHISTTKTRAGVRIIPMIDEVYDAFLQEYEIQRFLDYRSEEIDGYTNFVFLTTGGSVMSAAGVNRGIKEIVRQYNEQETEDASKEGREPLLLPHFSAHNLRHTFCTRLCENDMNVKVIQNLMGHSDITTTMDIYSEVSESKKREAVTELAGKIIVNPANSQNNKANE